MLLQKVQDHLRSEIATRQSNEAEMLDGLKSYIKKINLEIGNEKEERIRNEEMLLALLENTLAKLR